MSDLTLQFEPTLTGPSILPRWTVQSYSIAGSTPRGFVSAHVSYYDTDDLPGWCVYCAGPESGETFQQTGFRTAEAGMVAIEAHIAGGAS